MDTGSTPVYSIENTDRKGILGYDLKKVIPKVIPKLFKLFLQIQFIIILGYRVEDLGFLLYFIV